MISSLDILALREGLSDLRSEARIYLAIVGPNGAHIICVCVEPLTWGVADWVISYEYSTGS